MSTHDIEITFTGLCLFRQDGKDVVVELPDTRQGTPSHCQRPLRQHHAALITTSNNGAGYDDHPLEGMDETITSTPDGYLSPPDHLPSVPGLGGQPGLTTGQKHTAAVLRLKGGRFGAICRRATSCLSGPWEQSPDGRFRWQATWEGTIGTDQLPLDPGNGRVVTAKASSNGVIQLVIANLMQGDLQAWLKPWNFTVSPGHPGPDDDFRWFYWMHGWTNCADQEVPRPASSPGQVSAMGIPFTCLMGGG